MIYTSLAVIALSASAALSPSTRLIHMHSHGSQYDTRISIKLHNTSGFFRDVRVGGRQYEVLANQTLSIKAPAGTQIVADGPLGFSKRGDLIVQLNDSINEQTIDIK